MSDAIWTAIIAGVFGVVIAIVGREIKRTKRELASDSKDEPHESLRSLVETIRDTQAASLGMAQANAARIGSLEGAYRHIGAALRDQSDSLETLTDDVAALAEDVSGVHQEVEAVRAEVAEIRQGGTDYSHSLYRSVTEIKQQVDALRQVVTD